jgi:hypothetical protein
MRLCLLLAALLAATPAHASTTTTYDLINVTAGFNFDVSTLTPNYPVVLIITGTVTIDIDANAINSVNLAINGALDFMSSWNTSYPTVMGSWGPTFFAVDSNGNNGLALSLGNLVDPTVSVVLNAIWTQQWGQEAPVYTTGYATLETPLPGGLVLMLGGLFGLAWLRRRVNVSGYLHR